MISTTKRILCIHLPNWSKQRHRVAQFEVASAAPGRKPAADPFEDRLALERLAGWCERFSPIVGIEQSVGSDCLLLDITGLDHLFGGEAAMAQRIAASLKRFGLCAKLAIADTIGAAWAVANTLPVERTASGEATIFLIVPPGETAAALHRLPVEALRLTEQTVDLLHQLGIYQIGQLESLPRRELSSRLGRQLLVRMNQAAGRVDEPLKAYRCLPEFIERWSPDYPLERRAMIDAAFERLISRLATSLAAHGRGALRVQCLADCPPEEPIIFAVGTFEPSASAAHLLELMAVQLERVSFPAPLTRITVEASQTAPLEYRQQEMFSVGRGRQDLHRQLAGLIDRLSNRLGRRRVLRARLCNEAQPELAFRYDPLVGGSNARDGRRRARSHGQLLPRPLCLLPRPVVLSLFSPPKSENGALKKGTGTTTEGVPEYSRGQDVVEPVPFFNKPNGPSFAFQLDGRRYEVADSWGPERIETGWWRGRPIWRDYYCVETTAGQRLWIFLAAGEKRWFLHGLFE